MGDYDGDGLSDVALAVSWSMPDDEYGTLGTLSVWLTTLVPAVADPETSTGGTTTVGTTPPAPEAPAPTPEAPKRPYTCGCSGVSAPPGLLAALLLPFTRRRRPSAPG